MTTPRGPRQDAPTGQAQQDNTNNPVVTLASLMRRLSDVISAENEHIRAHRPAEARKLHEEKGKLSAAYSREMELVRKNGGITAFGSADQLRDLKRQTQTFSRLVDDHRKLVERSRAITEGMIKAISEEVSRRNRPAQTYGKNALPPPQDNRTANVPHPEPGHLTAPLPEITRNRASLCPVFFLFIPD